MNYIVYDEAGEITAVLTGTPPVEGEIPPGRSWMKTQKMIDPMSHRVENKVVVARPPHVDVRGGKKV